MSIQIIGNDAQFNNNATILGDLTVYGVVEPAPISGQYAPDNVPTFNIQGDVRLRRSGTDDGAIYFGDTNKNFIFGTDELDVMTFATNGKERGRIDQNGRLHVGYASNFATDNVNIMATNSGGLAILSDSDNGLLSTNDVIGSLSFQSYSDAQNASSAEVKISAIAAANHSTTSAPTDMVFYTKPSSVGPGSAPTERLRIDSEGNVNIGVNATSNPFTYLRFGASQFGAADIRPRDEASHKVGLSFFVDGTQDTTINPTERLRIASDGRATFFGTNEQDIIHISTGNAAGNTFANIRGDNEAGIRIRGGGSFDGGTIELAGGLRDTDPGIIKFSTGTGGTPTEAVRITSSGDLQFNSGFGSVQTAYGVRAWALWNGETNTIVDDGNIAGFTDHGTGTYTFTFDNNMPDNKYVITGSTGRNAKPHFSLSGNDRNASNFKISTGTWGSSYTAVDVDSAMFCVIH